MYIFFFYGEKRVFERKQRLMKEYRYSIECVILQKVRIMTFSYEKGRKSQIVGFFTWKPEGIFHMKKSRLSQPVGGQSSRSKAKTMVFKRTQKWRFHENQQVTDDVMNKSDINKAKKKQSTMNQLTSHSMSQSILPTYITNLATESARHFKANQQMSIWEERSWNNGRFLKLKNPNMRERTKGRVSFQSKQVLLQKYLSVCECQIKVNTKKQEMKTGKGAVMKHTQKVNPSKTWKKKQMRGER